MYSSEVQGYRAPGREAGLRPVHQVGGRARARGNAGRRVAALLWAALLASPAGVAAQWADIRVHDPVAIEAGGKYYVFSTGNGIPVFSSTDLKTWKAEPPVFETAPAWAASVNASGRGGQWAPDISFHNGQYDLFYSVSTFGSNNSAIGHATNVTLDRADPRFKWVDHGIVVRSVPGRDMYNAIDPNLAYDDAGTPWMVFGSFWSGMKLVKLAPDLNAPAQPQEWHTVAARPRYWKLDERAAGDPTNGAIEAPFIFHKNGWYYLFVSWDVCCRGVNSTYKVVVGRSKAITGPYLDANDVDMRYGGGSLVVKGDSTWAGVGHSGTYTFGAADYLVFHGYYLPQQGQPKLWVKKIDWDSEGWPHVSIK